jgi:hypothetical protein
MAAAIEENPAQSVSHKRPLSELADEVPGTNALFFFSSLVRHKRFH